MMVIVEYALWQFQKCFSSVTVAEYNYSTTLKDTNNIIIPNLWRREIKLKKVK